MRLPKIRPRHLAPALLVTALAAWAVLSWRAMVYGVAAERYAEYAVGYASADSFDERGFTTCYGQRWDDFSERVVEADIRAHARDRAYRDEQAARYDRLRRKYERAARAPWRHLLLDPPLKP